MFKAFLRTDGVVTVSGGDVAWKPQRKSFQRFCTKLFAYKLQSLPESTMISDFPPKLRTLICDEADFVGEPVELISDKEYQYCRSVLQKAATQSQLEQERRAY